jgi:hypothetical protein
MVLNCLGMALNASGKVFDRGSHFKYWRYFEGFFLPLYLVTVIVCSWLCDVLLTARGTTGPALISRGCALGWREKQPKSLGH